MPDAQPSSLSEVLAEEYQALRSGSSYAPSDPDASEPAKLAELFRKVHYQPKPFSALCISGGGIRSATFALGALQSMADHGFLTEFDYLSTVSGGGYIGSWLTAWIQRSGGLDKVVLARQIELTFDTPIDIPELVRRWRDVEPTATVFSTVRSSVDNVTGTPEPMLSTSGSGPDRCTRTIASTTSSTCT